MSFTPGGNIGAYRIIEQLGTGGMATVFKAYHPALDRYVAIKVMHTAFKGDPTFLTRFQREARVVAKLDHPSIVSIYDFSEHEGSPYLVMRFIEGETLKARLQRARLTLPEILDVIRPVGEALTYAHDQGVLHRDMKPSNVLLANDGRIFLTDFGLARVVQVGESSLTRDAMVGTPYYISPEQALGKSELDARTDIYSFGVVLYELLTGRVPFQADTPIAIIHDHIYSPLPMPSTVNPNLPPLLERVLLKALAKAPEDRFPSAVALVDAVDNAVAGEAVVPRARPDSARPTPRPTVPRVDREPPAETKITPRPMDAVAGPDVRPAPEPAAEARPSRAGPRSWLLALGGVAIVAVVVAAAVLLLTSDGNGDAAPPTAIVPSPEQAAGDRPPVDSLPAEENLAAYLERAAALVVGGDIDGGLAHFEEGISQHPEAIEAYLEMARVLFREGLFGPAAEVLRQGVRVNRDDVAMHLHLARALVGADRWEEAIGEFEWLIEHEPALAEPHAYLSLFLATQTDDIAGAEREAREALALDPDSPAAHFAMGVFHWQTRNLVRARIEFERARESASELPWLRQRIQLFLERLNQPDADNP